MVVIPRKLPTGIEKGIYFDGYYHDILKFYQNAIQNHNTSVVLLFDGRSGMGKTTLNNQTGIFLDPNFDIDKMFYTPNDFLEGLSKAKKGDYICFDEAMLLSNRSALSQVNRMIIIAMSMIRSKQIFVSFCVNSIFDLDKNIAISRGDILLHVYGDTLIDRGRYAAFFKAKDGSDRLKELYLQGKKYYSYAKPKANFVGSFTKEFVIDDKEYEKRKQDGINKFLMGSGQRETAAAIKKKEVMRKSLLLLLEHGHTQEELAAKIGISQSRISEITGQPAELSISGIKNYYNPYQEGITINEPVQRKKIVFTKDQDAY